MVDFPGLFEQRGAELDIAIHLTLQKILKTAKSTKVVVLVSATCFQPENSKIIDIIKCELETMFKDPHEHLIIAFTKSRLVEAQLGD